jgi:hypothetical protein
MMPTDSYLIPALFLLTFVLAIAFAIYQYTKVKKARREHHQSAQARTLGERPGERHVSPGGANSSKTADQKPQRPSELRS